MGVRGMGSGGCIRGGLGQAVSEGLGHGVRGMGSGGCIREVGLGHRLCQRG